MHFGTPHFAIEDVAFLNFTTSSISVKLGREYQKEKVMNETIRKDKKKIVAAFLLLCVFIGVLLGVYHMTKKQPTEGQKQIVVEVIHGDESTKEFELTTTEEYLGEVLKEQAIVEGEDGDYGLFITAADGEQADASNEEWWCLTKDNQMLETSADQTVIEDGAHYELTLTVGY